MRLAELDAEIRELCLASSTDAAACASASKAKVHREKLIEALELALPYVEKVAATAPTTHGRLKRQRQAISDVAVIKSLLRIVMGDEQ